MYERSTDSHRPTESEKVQTAAEVADSQGMGAHGQRSGNSPELPGSSDNLVPVAQGTATRGRDVSEWQAPPEGRTHQGVGRREPEIERSPCVPNPGTDAVKKKNELGLTDRRKGATYSGTQRVRIVARVEELKASGITKIQALRTLGVCRSSYYGWRKGHHDTPRKPSTLRLTNAECTAIMKHKNTQPHVSHRQISGYLRFQGVWVSPSSCYRILKALGWIEPRWCREAPWETAHYEPYRPNQIWGEDWTMLTIAAMRYYLLTIIDYFSRYIVAWGIVKTVTRREVQNLLALAFMSEQIDQQAAKPMVRSDRGSPNMAHSTTRLIKDLEMLFSPGRPQRPTDNARQERWYRTVKQEEIYCYPTYPTEEIARYSIASYIYEYNEHRPHQALWNFTPGYVHRLGNKTVLSAQYKKQVQIAKEQRIAFNRSQMSQL